MNKEGRVPRKRSAVTAPVTVAPPRSPRARSSTSSKSPNKTKATGSATMARRVRPVAEKATTALPTALAQVRANRGRSGTGLGSVHKAGKARRPRVRVISPPPRPTLPPLHVSIPWRKIARFPWVRAGLVVATIALVYSLFTSPTFAVHQVEAVGDANLPVSVLMQKCQCLGHNIFLMQPDKIRARLSQIPQLTISDVYGQLPDRLVVTAHFKSAAIIFERRGQYMVADATGQLIAVAPAHSSLPVIHLVVHPHTKAPLLRVGDHMDAAAMQTVFDLINALPAPLRARVATFRYDPDLGITVGSRDHWYATFGWLTGSVLSQRIAALQWVLGQEAQHLVAPFNYANLTYSTPYVRWENSGPWAH